MAQVAVLLLVRRHVSDVKREQDFVYVGTGDLSLRVAPSEWSSPFRVGPDGDASQCVRQYALLVASLPLDTLHRWRSS